MQKQEISFAGLLLTTVITCLLGITLTTVQATGSLQAAAMAKPNCEDKCGNLTIPFPFGMGNANCFLDEWFETVCDNSLIPHRLFLKRTNLEVINISLPNMGIYAQKITVKSWISFSKCGQIAPRESVDLTGAPFSISQENIFVAMSCGVRATVKSISGNSFSDIGCTSTCSYGEKRTASNHNNILCNGIDCCETSIPLILDSYKISFDDSNISRSDIDECKYGFVVSRSYWNNYKNRTSNITEIRYMNYVPLILSWDLLTYTYFDIFKTDLPNQKKMTSPSCYNRSYYDTSTELYASSGLKCQCYFGMLGNPYLDDGCSQDINECEEYNPYGGACSSGSTCVNTVGSYHCSYKNKFLIIGFGSAFGALFLLFALWRLYKGLKKRKETKRKQKFFKQNGGLLLQQQLSSGEGNIENTKVFNSNELAKATGNFSNDRILGQGGQGTVYKGMLEDGKIVAVKKSKVVDESKLSEFINEVVILSQINHRNVVQLLGCCLETEVPILVYEFIPNGTLSDYIHQRNEDFPFSWKMRVRIAAEVAGALAYLHSAAAFPIYHRDIKSTNILLDEKYRAKVADFGTSRTISLEQTHLTTLVYGTFGYLDPEYFQSSQFTEKSDVYSFGVVLVELLTGQKAICATRANEGRNLATYFIMSMEANALFEILDAQIRDDGPKEEVMIIASLALTCLSLSGRNRPTMKEVAMALEGLLIDRSETHSTIKQNYLESEFSFTEFIEPLDDASTSTGLVFDDTTRSSLPLLSLKPR